MHTVLRVLASLMAAYLGMCLFRLTLYQINHFDWLGYSYLADDLRDIHLVYVFGYTFVFAFAWGSRWPVTGRRRALATALAWAGGLVPLVGVSLHHYLRGEWYLRWQWILDDFFYFQKGACTSLLLSHAVLLLLLNGLFYFRPAPRPVAPVPAGHA